MRSLCRLSLLSPALAPAIAAAQPAPAPTATPPPPAAAAPALPPTDELLQLGQQLFDQLAPPEIKAQYEFPRSSSGTNSPPASKKPLKAMISPPWPTTPRRPAPLSPHSALFPNTRTTPTGSRPASTNSKPPSKSSRLSAPLPSRPPPQNPSPLRPHRDRKNPPPQSKLKNRKIENSLPHYDLFLARARTTPAPGRAAALLPVLRAAFVAEGIPPELVWLAEAESTFNPTARSPVGARGLYQLMPATAQELGLSTFLPDDRTDPEKSARAAARLLRANYEKFGSWPLALAAYNAGAGRVTRLLEKTSTKTYAGIAAALPAETRLYVPKVCALVTARAGVTPEKSPRRIEASLEISRSVMAVRSAAWSKSVSRPVRSSFLRLPRSVNARARSRAFFLSPPNRRARGAPGPPRSTPPLPRPLPQPCPPSLGRPPFPNPMNFRLRIFRALALLCIIPGLGVMMLGLGIGLQGGGPFWLLAATLVFFGGLLIWRTVEYFKQPSRPAAADLLTVLSLVIFSVISSSLRKSFPDAWGVPDKLGIGRDNADGVIMLVAPADRLDCSPHPQTTVARTGVCHGRRRESCRPALSRPRSGRFGTLTPPSAPARAKNTRPPCASCRLGFASTVASLGFGSSTRSITKPAAISRLIHLPSGRWKRGTLNIGNRCRSASGAVPKIHSSICPRVSEK